MSHDPYIITTDQRRFDLAAIHAFLSQSYWSPGVPFAVVERAVANSLATRDAHELYRQFGFRPLTHPSRMMEVLNPDAYPRPAS